MTVEGFEVVLNDLLTAQPFRIFTIELKGGKLYEVDFPGALHYRLSVAIFTSPGGVRRAFDADSVLQVVVAPAEDVAK